MFVCIGEQKPNTVTPKVVLKRFLQMPYALETYTLRASSATVEQIQPERPSLGQTAVTYLMS